MRPLLCLIIVLMLARSSSALAAEAEPLVEAQRLLEEHAIELDSLFGTAPPLDAFMSGRLVELARQDGVRDWLRERIRTLNRRRWGKPFAELLFTVLCMGGTSAAECDLLLELDRENPGYLDFGYLATEVLKRAPLAISEEIESKLLDPLARRAATTLDLGLAVPVWLLAKRLPAGRVSKVLQAAWKEASPLTAKATAKEGGGVGFAEISLLDPQGKLLPGTMLAFNPRTGNYPALFIWPDGKARLRVEVPGNAGVPIEFSFVTHGYHDEQQIKLGVSRGVRKETVRLGSRRSAIQGKLATLPPAPLFARLTRGIPLGFSLRSGLWNPGPYVDAVAADGSFRVPYTRRDNGDTVVFFDGDARVRFAAPVAIAAEGGDIDLGVLTPKAVEGLVDLPIAVRWPRGLPGTGVFVRVEWKLRPRAAREGLTACPGRGLRLGLGDGPGPVGTALNMPPGEYDYAVKFDHLFAPLSGSFQVTAEGRPLVLEPTPEATTVPVPSAQAPASAHPLAGIGHRFSLEATQAGEAALAWSEAHEVKLRLVKGSELGAARAVYERRTASDPTVGDVELRAGPDGDLHLFAQDRVDGKPGQTRCLRLSTAGEPRGAWVDLAAVAEEETQGLPAAIFLDPDTLLTLTPSLTPSGPRLLVGRLGSGGYQPQRVLQADHKIEIVHGYSRTGGGEVPEHFLFPPMVTGADEKGARFLCSEKDQLYWSPFGAVEKKVLAAAVGDGRVAPLSGAAYKATRDGRLNLCLQASGDAHPLRVGQGAAGKKLALRSLPRASFRSTTACAWIEDEGGKAHLVANAAGQLALWSLSGAKASGPQRTPWAVTECSKIDAVGAGPGAGLAAWSDYNRIHVRPLTLPKPGE